MHRSRTLPLSYIPSHSPWHLCGRGQRSTWGVRVLSFHCVGSRVQVQVARFGSQQVPCLLGHLASPFFIDLLESAGIKSVSYHTWLSFRLYFEIEFKLPKWSATCDLLPSCDYRLVTRPLNTCTLGGHLFTHMIFQLDRLTVCKILVP